MGCNCSKQVRYLHSNIVEKETSEILSEISNSLNSTDSTLSSGIKNLIDRYETFQNNSNIYRQNNIENSSEDIMEDILEKKSTSQILLPPINNNYVKKNI